MKNTFTIFAFSLVLFFGCSKQDDAPKTPDPANPAGLSQFELEHGIGPVKAEIKLGDIDKAVAAEGKAIFLEKCSACHKIGERYVGPNLAEVVKRRKPEYIMNMILNPSEMVEKHPVAKELLGEYLAPMANQNLKQEEARKVLEYFRTTANGEK